MSFGLALVLEYLGSLLLMAALSAHGWRQTRPGDRLPIRWDSAGQPMRTVTRGLAISLLPLIAVFDGAVVTVLLLSLAKPATQGLMRGVHVIVVAIPVLLHAGYLHFALKTTGVRR